MRHHPCTSTCRSIPLLFLFFPLLLVLFTCGAARAQHPTRGIGVYPGDPAEDFSPAMKIDAQHYRNLALHRPAYQSSSYDYNLTAQLLTDGIKEIQLPGWIITTTGSDGIVARNEREWAIDHHPMTRKTIEGENPWLQIELAGNSRIPDIDSFNISGSLFVDSLPIQPWVMTVLGADDTTKWVLLAEITGNTLPGDTAAGWWRHYMPLNFRFFGYAMKSNAASHYRFYRLQVHAPNAISWGISEFAMFHDGVRAEIGGPYRFSSAWMSAGSIDEWVYVDLGAPCSFDRVVLSWLRRPAVGAIQVSDDASHWIGLVELPPNRGRLDDIKLAKQARGRYVRVMMNKPAAPGNYILSEIEVFGKGGPVPVAHAQKASSDKNRIELAGGAWRLQRSSFVSADGTTLSRAGFDDSDWMIATVPATTLVSYLNAGAIPDPTFGDNQLLISDSYFYSDFWYRDRFVVPAIFKNKTMCLNFDGINWKADVYLNGVRLGIIEGAFTRACFNVTEILKPGAENVLAVLIRKNAHPGYVKEQTKLSHDSNGGELGADNPTYHASVGWDWIPTIRGRNTGIWNDVYVSASGPVTIDDPFIVSHIPLPDTTTADVRIELMLTNHARRQVSGILRGMFGRISFKQPVTIGASGKTTVVFDPSTHPALHLAHPKLWWPNGYGAQNLYSVTLTFTPAGGASPVSKTITTGVREMSYSEKGGVLRIWINGKRFVAKGGNWGFPESMLRYRAREYDIAVRYHKEMNFTMIRNWVGQTGDDEFFKACDKYGIMVWQDFWLANPLDGPDPVDDGMFKRNAGDFIRRIRNHPSVGLYCGRNEGNPPDPIDAALRILISKYHPDVHYISNSAFDVVSGGGSYRAMPVKFYFEKRATEKLHSEIGMPNMVSFESLRKMMPDSTLWPIGRMWGIHDFTLESAQYGKSFIELLTENFGTVDDLHDWLTLAQWVNYDGYRAIFEAQSKHRMGALLWMSHPAWPSMVWQTYDYYFEPTAAYFACKKACEPIHIQWNAFTDSIEVVNYSSPSLSGLKAGMELFDITGTLLARRDTSIDCPEDTCIRCYAVDAPASVTGESFLRLTLLRGAATVSQNFYWCRKNSGDLKLVRVLPMIKLKRDIRISAAGGNVRINATLTNTTAQPAFMVKLSIVGKRSRTRILPVWMSDNFISLMPGDKRTIAIEVKKADLRGDEADVQIEGIDVRE